MVFALVALPLFAMIGISLDLSRAHTTKRHIQEAMDSSILWAASEMANGGVNADQIETDGADFEARAEAVFLDNLRTRGVSDAICSAPEVDAQPLLKRVTGTADCRVPLTFASIVGDEDLVVKTDAAAVFGGEKVEIALMLDVSGSMRGQRLSDLQDAARDLIDTLIPVTHVGDVRISLVPYATAVNAGSYGDVVTGITDLYAHTVANLGADPDKLVAALNDGDTSESFDLVDAAGNDGLASLPPEFFACVTSQPDWTDIPVCQTPGGDGSGHDDCVGTSWTNTDVSSLLGSDFPLRVCTGSIIRPDDDDDENPYCPEDNSVEVSHSEVHGCIDGTGSASDTATAWQALDWSAASMSYADYDFSVLGATHEANVGALNCVTERADEMFTDASPITFPMGAQASTCPGAPVEPLTHNKTILKNAIDSLHADGWTAGHLGIAWTWYTLSPDWSVVWPFGRRTEAGGAEAVRRYAVLMTDGSFNTHYINAGGNSSAKAQKLCTAMKTDGITIFSVAFNAPTSSQAVLRNCASSTDNYFEATNGSELAAAYADIADSVSGVRLSD